MRSRIFRHSYASLYRNFQISVEASVRQVERRPRQVSIMKSRQKLAFGEAGFGFSRA